MAPFDVSNLFVVFIATSISVGGCFGDLQYVPVQLRNMCEAY